MTDQNTAVLVDNVFKSYGSTKVLDGISLEVFQGELIALLGPSGCGKTTLLRLVAGLAFPAAGGIYIMGKDVTNTPTNGRNTAMVFQNYALFPHMNVLENVTFGLHFRRKHSKEQMRSKAKDVLSMAGLTGLEQRKPAQLSGGEQQRVALARALILEPEVLLLDEPLSNLDYRLRMSMRLEIRRLQRQTGITTIFVTHDQGEALSMSQRVAVISNGKVEQIGAPLDIYERPGTPFVADFIGETNFFKGIIQNIEEDRIIIKTEHGTNLTVTAPERQQTIHTHDEVLVMIRPEKIDVGRADAIFHDQVNVFEGMIDDVVYGGSSILYQVQLGNGERAKTVHSNYRAIPFSVKEKVKVKLDPSQLTFIFGTAS
ncbi:MAG TPA: ABC transporter ATP-binding protein [Candidatus Bathyarchaeia archaeon]|nr:ABC transporter ATP-binding protein [Candidatus Bathyarchaeia archaeon]